MSFNNFEESFKVFEDLNEAPRLRARIGELEEEQLRKDRAYAEEKEELQEENARLAESLWSLKAQCKELVNLRIAFDKESYSLRELDSLVNKRMDQEVNNRIDKKALKLSEEKLPSLIEAEIKGYPTDCSEVTRRTVEEIAVQLRDKYLKNPSMWSPWFKLKVEQEAEKQVAERMDQKFWDIVSKRADREINHRLPGAWRLFLRDYATSFMKNTLQAQLLSLTAPVEYACLKCGATVQVTLTPDALSSLLRKGWISCVCPYRKGFLKHNFRISLGELFWYIMKGDVTPMRTIILRPRVRIKSVADASENGTNNVED